VQCGELQPAGLAAEQFDLCVISDVLEHVRSPLDFLREVHRVLKPDGTLFIATPSIDRGQPIPAAKMDGIQG